MTCSDLSHQVLKKTGRFFKPSEEKVTDEYTELGYMESRILRKKDKVSEDEFLAVTDKVMGSFDGVIITDHKGVILQTNNAFIDTTGYDESEIIGQTLSLLSSGKHDMAFYKSMWASIYENGSWSGEIWNKRKNGEIYSQFLQISAMNNDVLSVTHYVASFSDLSVIKNIENELETRPNFDESTGLLSRAYFLKRLNQTIQAKRVNESNSIFLYVRLNKVSKFNSHLSVVEVDGLIMKFIKKIEALFHEYHYYFGRISCSDFAIVINQLEPEGVTGKAQKIAELIVDIHEESQSCEDFGVHNLDPRIGLCSHPSLDPSVQAEDMLEKGLFSVWEALEKGESFRFYSELSQQAAQAQHNLEMALIEALKTKDEFELYHQPQYNQDGKITGGEVLIRWNHQGSFISPAVFIPFAEKSNYILEIGHWIFHEAISQIIELKSKNLLSTYSNISINFSAKQLMSEQIFEHLPTLLEKYPFIVNHLTIEITETAIIEDISKVKRIFQSLRNHGFKISLDDFGTGYSSLSHLYELDFDELKIDKSFVDHVEDKSHKGYKLIRSILKISEILGVNVVAEGIENLKQFEALKELKCSHYQGYFLSKPVPFKTLVKDVL